MKVAKIEQQGKKGVVAFQGVMDCRFFKFGFNEKSKKDHFNWGEIKAISIAYAYEYTECFMNLS